MTQPNRDSVGKGFRLQMDLLVGSPVIGMLHDVAARLSDRQFNLPDGFFVELCTGKIAAEGADELAYAPKLPQVAMNLQIRVRLGAFARDNFDDHASHIIRRRLRLRKGKNSFANGLNQIFRLQRAVALDALRQPSSAEQLVRAIARLGNAVRKKHQQVVRFEGNGLLVVDLPFSEAQGQVVSMQNLTAARRRLAV